MYCCLSFTFDPPSSPICSTVRCSTSEHWSPLHCLCCNPSHPYLPSGLPQPAAAHDRYCHVYPGLNNPCSTQEHKSVGVPSLSTWFQRLCSQWESKILTMLCEGPCSLGPAYLSPLISILPSISFCSRNLLPSQGFALAFSSAWMALLPGLSMNASSSSFQTQRRLHWPPNMHPRLCDQQLAVSLPCFIFFMAFSHVWNDLSYLLVYVFTASLPHWNASSMGKGLCIFYINIPSPYTTLGPQVPNGWVNEPDSVVEN